MLSKVSRCNITLEQRCVCVCVCVVSRCRAAHNTPWFVGVLIPPDSGAVTGSAPPADHEAREAMKKCEGRAVCERTCTSCPSSEG
jgi:hypothetical protein